VRSNLARVQNDLQRRDNRPLLSLPQHGVITLQPQHPDKPAFDIVAVVDPATQGAQKVSALLLVLKDVLNAKIRVFLNCVDKHSEMPLKSYFRVVLVII
jgi:UDP-glucose:glycoprotein glucosyltransferase